MQVLDAYIDERSARKSEPESNQAIAYSPDVSSRQPLSLSHTSNEIARTSDLDLAADPKFHPDREEEYRRELAIAKSNKKRIEEYGFNNEEDADFYATADQIIQESHDKIGVIGRVDILNEYGKTEGKPRPVRYSHGKNTDPMTVQQTSRVTEFIGRIASKDLLSSIPKMIVVDTTPEEGNRSYYYGTMVKVGRFADESVVIHEIGHHLELTHEGVRDKVAAFWDKRFGGEEPQSLAVMFPGRGFEDDEMGRKDDMEKLFPGQPSSAFYAGKNYSNGSTEVLSVGMQLMWSDPKRFKETDPEYFDLVMDCMGAKKKKKKDSQ